MTTAAIDFVALGRCVLCEAAGGRERFVLSDVWMGVPGRFRYCECPSCGTVFQDPQVAGPHISRLYPETYYTHPAAAGASPPLPPPRSMGGVRDRWREALREAGQGRGGFLARALARSRTLRERAAFGLADELIPRSADRRVLEVGCGGGGLLALLVRAGWPQVEGLDFDPAAAERARAHSGCPVRVAAFPDPDLPAGAFDLIVMVHSFEHLPDPRAALAHLRELLARGGRAVLFAPNPAALGARVFGFRLDRLGPAAAPGPCVPVRPRAGGHLPRPAPCAVAHTQPLRLRLHAVPGLERGPLLRNRRRPRPGVEMAGRDAGRGRDGHGRRAGGCTGTSRLAVT